MPYVTSIERLARKEGRQEGRQKGRREGRQEGLQEGARTELLETIRAGLKDRFGSTASRLMARVRAIDDLPRLRNLARALFKVESPQAFRDLLD